MTRARSRGNSLLSSVTEAGVSLRIDDITDTFVSPVNGRCPVAIS